MRPPKTVIGLNHFFLKVHSLNSISANMPPLPTIHRSPLKKFFVCAQCYRKFRSKSGRTRHINAKHAGLPVLTNLNSPQSAEADRFSEVSSCPGSLSPAPLSHVFESPSRTGNLDLGGENDFIFGNSDIDPPGDTASTSTEYHPYLNGKINNI